MSPISAARGDLESFARFPVDYIHPSRAIEWLPDLPESLACNIAENERLRPKVSSIILSAYGLEECSEPLDEAEADIVTLPFETLTRVAVIAGSIWNANWLRLVIDRSVLVEVFGDSGHSHYSFAISNAHLAGSQSDPAITGRTVAAAVLTDGFGCLLSWVNSLPPSFSGRVWLKFPRGYSQQPLPEGCSPEAARNAVRAAAKYIQSYP